MPDEQLLKILQGIIEDIHKKVDATDWTKEKRAKKVKREIQDLLRRFDVAVDELVPDMIAKEYFKGIEQASKLLVNEDIDTTTGKVLGANGRIKPEFRKPIYLDALEEILDDTFIDLKAARRTAERSALATIDEVVGKVKDEIAKGLVSGNTRKVMQQNVADAFRDGGLTAFITSDNRKLPLDFYAMTVTRTKTREAGVQAASKRYIDNGMDLVKIMENSDSCDICSRYKDMVFSLTGDTTGFPVAGPGDLPPYHPNCYGTTAPYNIKRKTVEEVDKVNARNAAFDPEGDRRSKRGRAEYEKTQRLRREARDELKQFQKWNALVRAENYKTLGAFRTAKRSNSPRFQELQSLVRSAARNKV